MNTENAFEVRAGVAIIRLEHPPVNTLSRPVRRALLGGLLQAERAAEVRAIVIAGAGRMFSAGADIGEFARDAALSAPTLEPIHTLIESLAKPVVAAVQGCAIGGALELALACHARVASPEAVLGLPETTLGLMPGAGGTQRLPRALGLERAVNMIVGGTTHPAREFAHTALIDLLVEGDVVEAACRVALNLSLSGPPFPLLLHRQIDHPEPAGFLAHARANAAARRDFTQGMRRAIDAMELIFTVSPEEGCTREFQMFRELLAGDEAHALCHAFLAERAAPKLLAGSDRESRPIGKAAIVGAGFMGTGIGICLARAGLAVALFDPDAKAATLSAARIREESGAESPVRSVGSYAELADAELVIEAAPEQFDVKRAIFRELDAVVGPTTLLASNTSSLDIDALARSASRPERVLGLHFFAPAQTMRLVEVVRGSGTSPDTVASGLALARQIGKVPVLSAASPGFIGNRLFDQMLLQALSMAAEGARPWEIDAAVEGWGMRMGPFRVMDMIGNDLLASARAGRIATAGTELADRLVGAGRFGQKSGCGWYRYPPNARRGVRDPTVESLLPSPKSSLDARSMVDRCVLALVNEGSRVIQEGVVQRPSDIDVVFLLGYGFPRRFGGPMFYADRRGLPLVERSLRMLRDQTGDPFWDPAPLLARLAADQACFITASRD